MKSDRAPRSRSFTGRRGRRTARMSVRLTDALSRACITAGGIGTIAAVLGVSVFLVWVAIPLLRPARIHEPRVSLHESRGASVWRAGVDEYRSIGTEVRSDGMLVGFRLDTGERLFERPIFPGVTPTCASFVVGGSHPVFGFADGTLRTADIGFKTSFVEPAAAPEEVRRSAEAAGIGVPVRWGDGMAALTPEGQIRVQRIDVAAGEARRVSDPPILQVTHIERPGGTLGVFLTASPPSFSLFAVSGTETQDFSSGETTFAFDAPVLLPYPAGPAQAPMFLGISGTGSELFIAWPSGRFAHLNIADLGAPFVAETGRLVPESVALTAVAFVLGGNTLVWGDSRGGAYGGFAVAAAGFDGQGLYGLERDARARRIFALTKEYARSGPIVTALAPSTRSRLILAGFADGEVALFSATSETRLASRRLPVRAPVSALAVAPREDALLASTADQVFMATMDTRHPEASVSSLFRPVWYEGYQEPSHMWQSSAATDDAEIKLGLMPLVVGTAKATVYAILFGAPLALLSAIFTSEFLHRRAKAVVKPTIEMMASLPSVVLGFLAALVFAPFVENVVPAVMCALFLVPVAFLAGGHAWRMAPPRWTRRLTHLRPLLFPVPLGVAVGAAALAGPRLERWFFGGDFKQWLAWEPSTGAAAVEKFGSATGGWFLLCLPVMATATALFFQRFVSPRMGRRLFESSRSTVAPIEAAKFAAAVAVAIAATLVVSVLLDRLGGDVRGTWLVLSTDLSPLDLYVQRNALIVGFVMGFAVIPIIYTIAEDSLAAVPDHLRSASLGAGATRWQTAVRIVAPTAMSGLFSAVMVGMGRAVGETMIVLMALGNTAVMDLNLFNGARTLSANIAVELPEAVRDSTHYRTLFLAALVLFSITFVVNTVAETVKARFRKKAVQL